MRHDLGLAASPPVRYKLEMERSGYFSFRLSSSVDGQPPREAAARRVRRYEKFFTRFSKAGSNVVESAAMLMEFVAATHERSVLPYGSSYVVAVR